MSRSVSTAEALPRPAALRLIIGYKLVKGAASLTLAMVLVAALALGKAEALHGFAERLREHMARAWAVHLADAVVRVAEGRNLILVAVALFSDGILTTVEGWGLARGWWWAPWLVVIATGTLLPFEVAAMVHGIHIGRLLVFLANLLIVAYLARKALHESRQSRRA